MAAPTGTHGTVGVAAQCQRSLTSSASLDASSRSPSQGNKSGDALHFNDFPTVAFQNRSAPFKNRRGRPGEGQRRVPAAQQRKGKY